jgi:Protein of unknown function (DUF4236)
MSWRFRKSFRVLPGVRINVSRRGISTTIGRGPLSVHVGPTGTYANFNLPGTGISHRQRIGGTADESHHTIVGDELLPQIPPASGQLLRAQAPTNSQAKGWHTFNA